MVPGFVWQNEATRSEFLLGIDDSSELNFLRRVLDDDKGARFILPSLRTLQVGKGFGVLVSCSFVIKCVSSECHKVFLSGCQPFA